MLIREYQSQERHGALIIGSILLGLVLGALGGCQVYNVDTYYTAQPNWYQEEIDIAFQMDGNYAQQPYSVWLDEVNLLAN